MGNPESRALQMQVAALQLEGYISDLKKENSALHVRIAELEGEAELGRIHAAGVCRALGREQSQGYSADDIRRLVERIAELEAGLNSERLRANTLARESRRLLSRISRLMGVIDALRADLSDAAEGGD